MKQFRLYEKHFSRELVRIPAKNLAKTWWGWPAVFTVADLDTPAFQHVKPTMKKRLRGLTPGTELYLMRVSGQSTLIAMVDEDGFDRSEVERLELELKQVNAEIQRVAGTLIKRANELRENLKRLY